MKLATLNDGSRDGQLVVVSRDLMSAHYATGIADRMQQVLDDWNFISPQLQDLYVTLNQGKARHAFVFDARQCMAPLPRAYLLAVASTATQASALLRPDFGDSLRGACSPIHPGSGGHDLDFEAALTLVTEEIPQGANAAQALDGVRLLMLSNHLVWRDWQVRPQQAALASPAVAFSPVAVTLDELIYQGVDGWRVGPLNLSLQSSLNGSKLGLGEVTTLPGQMADWLAQLCQSRALRPGSLLSSGEVRYDQVSQGFHSIASRRAAECAQDGEARSAWLAHGDHLLLDAKGPDGQSVFGAIDQTVLAV